MRLHADTSGCILAAAVLAAAPRHPLRGPRLCGPSSAARATPCSQGGQRAPDSCAAATAHRRRMTEDVMTKLASWMTKRSHTSAAKRRPRHSRSGAQLQASGACPTRATRCEYTTRGHEAATRGEAAACGPPKRRPGRSAGQRRARQVFAVSRGTPAPARFDGVDTAGACAVTATCGRVGPRHHMRPLERVRGDGGAGALGSQPLGTLETPLVTQSAGR